jgi:hypothetical protein
MRSNRDTGIARVSCASVTARPRQLTRLPERERERERDATQALGYSSSLSQRHSANIGADGEFAARPGHFLQLTS